MADLIRPPRRRALAKRQAKRTADTDVAEPIADEPDVPDGYESEVEDMVNAWREAEANAKRDLGENDDGLTLKNINFINNLPLPPSLRNLPVEPEQASCPDVEHVSAQMVEKTHGMPYHEIESDALVTVSLREQLEQPDQASMSQIDSDALRHTWAESVSRMIGDLSNTYSVEFGAPKDKMLSLVQVTETNSISLKWTCWNQAAGYIGRMTRLDERHRVVYQLASTRQDFSDGFASGRLRKLILCSNTRMFRGAQGDRAPMDPLAVRLSTFPTTLCSQNQLASISVTCVGNAFSRILQSKLRSVLCVMRAHTRHLWNITCQPTLAC